MNQVKKECYVVPDWSLPYLINGDASGLTDEEVGAVDRFLARLHSDPGYHVILDAPEEESYFSPTNAITNQGASCQNLIVVYLEETAAARHAKVPHTNKPRIRTLTIPVTQEVWEQLNKKARELAFHNASTMARSLVFYWAYLHPDLVPWEDVRVESSQLVNRSRELLSQMNQYYRKPTRRSV